MRFPKWVGEGSLTPGGFESQITWSTWDARFVLFRCEYSFLYKLQQEEACLHCDKSRDVSHISGVGSEGIMFKPSASPSLRVSNWMASVDRSTTSGGCDVNVNWRQRGISPFFHRCIYLILYAWPTSVSSVEFTKVLKWEFVSTVAIQVVWTRPKFI